MSKRLKPADPPGYCWLGKKILSQPGPGKLFAGLWRTNPVRLAQIITSLNYLPAPIHDVKGVSPQLTTEDTHATYNSLKYYYRGFPFKT